MGVSKRGPTSPMGAHAARGHALQPAGLTGRRERPVDGRGFAQRAGFEKGVDRGGTERGNVVRQRSFDPNCTAMDRHVISARTVGPAEYHVRASANGLRRPEGLVQNFLM